MTEHATTRVRARAVAPATDPTEPIVRFERARKERKVFVYRVHTRNMREAERTTRQRIADRLRDEPAQPGTLAREFEVTTDAVYSHVTHLSHSLEHEAEQLLVAPPTCRECGFSAFDDLVNRPSRCPSCKSEAVEEPTFVIE